MTAVASSYFSGWDINFGFRNNTGLEVSSPDPSPWGSRNNSYQKATEILKSIDADDELDPKTKELLGNDGLARYEAFQQYSPMSGESSMSKLSVAVMSTFVSALDRIDFEPSLFLTSSGNLELGWEDESGQQISVEFYSDRIEYFIEKNDCEGEVGVDIAEIKSIFSESR